MYPNGKEVRAMTIEGSLVSASWDVPSWAEVCSTDEDAVIYSRVLGQMVDLNGGDLSVELVQRDELSISADTVSFIRRPAYLRVAGELIEAQGIARFARMLMTANDLIEQQPDLGTARRGTAAECTP